MSDEYWFGSTDGLYYYNGDTAILTQITELQESWITHIHNQNDTVWIGTQTDGIFQIINKKVAKKYNEANDLSSNNCKALVIGSNGIVWVGTNNGLNKINIYTDKIDLINYIDGLIGSDINALAIENKTIYVGTSEGLSSFNKFIKTKNEIAPPIYLSSFQLFEKDKILSKSYTLKHDENNISIGFTGFLFRS